MEIEQLSEWLWCLRTPEVQAYAVREGDGFNLIDTLVVGHDDDILGALAAIAACRRDEVRLYEIALTHAHGDHYGSAAALVARTGATVTAPGSEAAVVEGDEVLPPPTLRDWERPLWDAFGRDAPLAPPVAVRRRTSPGERLPWARAPEVIAAPGHTPGSVAYWFELDRVLVAGDAIAVVEGRPVAGVFNVDHDLASRTFAELAELDAEIICVGHGIPLVGGQRLRAALGA